MSSLFKKILNKAKNEGVKGRSRRARDWFRRQAEKLSSVSRRGIINDGARFVRKVSPGNIYQYFYDPKLKKKLPYYDRFPLTLVIDVDRNSFLGLNLHYLKPTSRAKLLLKLHDIANNLKFDRTTKIMASYQILKSAAKYKEFKPTLKRYLTDHLNSRILKIDPTEWEIAIWLDTASFKKASQTQVWSDSRRKI